MDIEIGRFCEDLHILDRLDAGEGNAQLQEHSALFRQHLVQPGSKVSF